MGSRGIALAIWISTINGSVSSKPCLAALPSGKSPGIPFVQEDGWALGPVWKGIWKKTLAPTWLQTPNRPACKERLYRLRYPSLTHSNRACAVTSCRKIGIEVLTSYRVKNFISTWVRISTNVLCTYILFSTHIYIHILFSMHIYIYMYIYMDMCIGVVAIANCWGLDAPGIECWWGRDFLCRLDRTWGHTASVQRVPGLLRG
jgi:hypothetical protein